MKRKKLHHHESKFMKRNIFWGFLFLVSFMSPTYAGPSSIQLPHFASLKSKEINVRVGPGVQYPVRWVLIREHMPIEITAEFDVWRKIRDFQGTEGWVHKSMLSSKRFVIIVAKDPLLRKDVTTPTYLARIEQGVIAELIGNTQDFCNIKTQGYKGFLKREEVWGIYPNER